MNYTDHDPSDNVDDETDYISRTEKKHEAEDLQKLGGKLVKLSDAVLNDMHLPEELHDAVKFAQTIRSHGAIKRQMQYIGTLMRRIDPAPIQEAIDQIEQGSYNKAAAFKEIETWRDELIRGNKTLIEEILRECPDADRQQLTQLVRNAVKEKALNKPPKAYRILFRYLTSIKKTNSSI